MIRRVAARVLAPDVLILCYHAVSPTWPATLSVTPDQLARQVELLLRRGYRGATFTEAARRDSRDSPTFAVTFDDAFCSVLERGFPVLRDLGVPATVFAPTGHVGADHAMRWDGIDRWAGGPHERELLPLGWDELRELAAAGWEIGSHTVSHPRLTMLDDAELARELSESRCVCTAQLGRPCTSIAYPYGDVDRRVGDAAVAAGYTTGAALPDSLRHWHPLAWPRIGVYHADDERRFAVKIFAPGRRVRSTRVYERAFGRAAHSSPSPA